MGAPDANATRVMGVRFTAAAVTLAAVLVAAHAGLNVGHLARTYKLTDGRSTACPSTLVLGRARRAMTVPAWTMSADGAKCRGPGGKVLRSGANLLSSGLRMPSLVRGPGARFFVGVESATRVCGQWAFNASSVSYFVASAKKYRDRATGIVINPDHLYLAYAHFATLCVYRSWIPVNVRRQINKVEGGASSSAFASKKKKRACFPGAATVRTRTGTRRLDELQEGDQVLAAPGVYSSVFMFSHRDPAVRAHFVRVNAGASQLDLSDGHLLYVNGALTPAARVRVGDTVRLADGSNAAVNAVSSVEGRGLYAPHTLHGDIVVDGVAASCYTTAVKVGAAHALLAPLRISLIRRNMAYVADRMFDALRHVPVLPSAITGSA